MSERNRIRPAVLLLGVSGERNHGRGKKAFTASLDGVTVLLEPGTSLGILGGRRDGAGLISEFICGTRQPSSGRIFVNGDPVALDDSGSFLPRETLRFNLVRFGMAYQMSGQRLRSAVEIVAAEAGFETAALDAEAGSIEQDALERARFYLALATGTRVLIVDESEVLFGLLQQESERKKLDTFRRRGGSLVLVSHDPRHLAGTADRIAWLRDGEIIMEKDSAAVIRWRKQLVAAERGGDKVKAGQLLRRFKRQYEPPSISLRGDSRRRAALS